MGSHVNLFRPHPWHGLEVGPSAPEVVNAYIEITPFDLMKYEVDKISGYLRVDRPQRSSSQPPAFATPSGVSPPRAAMSSSHCATLPPNAGSSSARM